jgi:predicted transcriptional regulator
MNVVDEYLDACGVWPISVVKFIDGYGYAAGVRKSRLPSAVNVHWANSRSNAIRVVRLARRIKKRHPDKADAERELQRAASSYGVILTPDLIVQSRANMAAKRLQDYITAIDRAGTLSDFKKAYRRRRLAATARGHSFMTYGNAQKRLRRVLIRKLTGQEEMHHTSTFFAEVFGEL